MKVSTSPTTVTVTTPSSPVEVDSVITSSKGASVLSADTSGCPSAGRSEVVTDSAPLGGRARWRTARTNLPLARAPGADGVPDPARVGRADVAIRASARPDAAVC